MPEIIGNVTITNGARPDWTQNDPKKSNYINNKPAIKQGDNDTSIIIGDGVASGKYSIAGGTASTDLFAELIGDYLASSLDVSISQAQGDLSLALGVDNIAKSAGSFAAGVSNKTGINGYYWHSIDFSNNTITLTTKRPHATGDQNVVAPTGLDWVEGDYLIIVNGDIYPLCAKIESITNNVITVSGFTQGLAENAYDSNKILGDGIRYPASAADDLLGLAASLGKFYTFPYDRGIFALHINEDESIDAKKKSIYTFRSGLDDVSLGFGAFATGGMNAAVGSLSKAEGYNTLAAAQFSHAEGNSTITAGNCSHAEGKQTKALGYAAHSEGIISEASQRAAHSEGEGTIANRHAAHAEGYNTIAGWDVETNGQGDGWTGGYAHAEGENTKAVHYAAHAEGKDTEAKGYASHAEGIGTITANETAQHVQGKYNVKTTRMSFIIGGGTSDTDRKNIVEVDWEGNAIFNGVVTAGGKELADRDSMEEYINHKIATSYVTAGRKNGTAEASYSTAEGYQTTSSHDAAHAEGWATIANRPYTHAEGYKTIAGYDQSVVDAHGVNIQDDENSFRGSFAHAEGEESKALNYATHAEGCKCIAFGNSSHAGGSHSYSIGTCSFAHGIHVCAKEDYQTVLGRHNADSPDALLIVGNGETLYSESNAFEVISNDSGVALKIGNTTLTEAQLIKLINFIDTIEG